MKKIILSIIILVLAAVAGMLALKHTHNRPAGETVNLCFNIDDNYVDHLLLVLNSVFKNNKSNSHYHIYVIEEKLTRRHTRRIERYVRSRGGEVDFVDVKTRLKDNKINIIAGRNTRVTPIAMSRVILTGLLPQHVDRVIYLDADILVLHDLKALWDLDLEGNLAAMVPDIAPERNFAVASVKPYYNSGVMLIDLKKWREEHVQEKMLGFLNTNYSRFSYKGDRYEQFYCPDQDLVNIIMAKKIKTLDVGWNTFPSAFETAENVYILHFIGENKPWIVDRQPEFDECFDLYTSYWLKSPFRFLYFKTLAQFYFTKYKELRTKRLRKIFML